MSLSIEDLKSVLDYDQSNGHFSWLKTTKNRKGFNECLNKSPRAGHLKKDGYRVICVFGKRYYEHRLAWFYMTSEWPSEIDHINHKRDDNSWHNLRETTRQVNNFNLSPTPRKQNKCGVKGVRFYKPTGKWQARIQFNKTPHHLGYFENQDDANNAYTKAAASLGRNITQQG